MANMELQQRNQYERADLGATGFGARETPTRGLAIYAVISTLVLVALGYAAVQEISDWAGAVVLGVILLNVVGLIIAVRPGRSSPIG